MPREFTSGVSKSEIGLCQSSGVIQWNYPVIFCAVYADRSIVVLYCINVVPVISEKYRGYDCIGVMVYNSRQVIKRHN